MRKLRYREVLILIRREKHSSSPQILTEALQVGAEIRAIQLDTSYSNPPVLRLTEAESGDHHPEAQNHSHSYTDMST